MQKNVAQRWPLVGRSEEVGLCSGVLLEGDVPGVVLAGAAGVGKTRVASEALETVSAAGFEVIRATATHVARTIPFGALAHLLPGGTFRYATPVELLRASRAALVDRDVGRGLVVGVDDAHLLDAASATLIHQLAEAREALLVVTIRTGVPCPDSIVALWKDEACEYVELQPLSYADLSSLLEAVVGSVDGPSLRMLWEATRGTPLLVREIVLEGLARNVLVERGGIWHWQGGLVPGRRLRDLIESRLEELGEPERRLIEALALGEPLGRSFFSGRAAPEADELIRRGLAEEVRDGRRVGLRMAHPLHAEVVRAGIPIARALSVQSELAESLDATGARRRDDVLRLALWRLETGGPADADVLLRAAQHAATLFDPNLAERLARAADEAGAGFPARLATASALAAQARFEEAEALLARLASEARTDAERTTTAVMRARNLMGGLRRGADAAAVVAQAEEVVQDADQRRQLAAARGFVHFRLGRVGEAADAFRELAEDPEAETTLGVYSAGQFAFAKALAGRPQEGIEVTDAWCERGKPVPANELPSASLRAGRALSCAILGDLDQAEALERESYDIALATRDANEAALSATFLGLLMLMRGRLRIAIRWLREAASLLEEFDPLSSRPWPLAFAAQASAQAGECGPASSALAEAEAAAASGAPLQQSSILLARAWVAVDEGALSEAHLLAREAADVAADLGQFAPALMALHDLARIGDPQSAATLLPSVASQVEGPLLGTFIEHIVTLSVSDGPGLERCAEAFHDLGTFLYAAEGFAAAAMTYAESGRDSSARRAAARASSLRERCEGAVTPPLRASNSLAELTRREREIAIMAAGGLSSAEIASRLVLSVRTVDNHLQHVYGKLGISRRADLGQALSLNIPEARAP